MPPVVPAQLAFAADGTPVSPLYGDIYHSSHGAAAQARHVFLGGNGLPERWLGAEGFVILETGFGLGLNFLATWQAWREAGRACRLHFVSIEKHPFRRDDLRQLLGPHAEFADLAAELVERWPPLTAGTHRLGFDADQLTLMLVFDDAGHALPQLVATADAVFLDGFAPACNPELWSAALLARLTQRCRPDATLATWCVAGEVRRSLAALGWEVERQPGFATKREMLVARRVPDAARAPAAAAENRTSSAVPPAPTFASDRHAIVIGAGLAGCAVTERLAARGWRIDLFERQLEPAREASGNPAGVVLPRLAKDDALGARLSRACFLYAIDRLRRLPGVRWAPCGVFHMSTDADHEVLQREAIARQEFPADYAAFLDRDAATRLLGHAVARGGWWFPSGGWVAPGSACRALLAAAGDAVTARFGIEVAAIRREGDQWVVVDAGGTTLAAAPHLILANAVAANRLLPRPMPLSAVRGQVSFLPDAQTGQLSDVRSVLCSSGYLTPPAAGTVCFGASFKPGDEGDDIRLDEHRENLGRFDELLPGRLAGLTPGLIPGDLGGRVGFRTASPDRLPLVGPLPDLAAAGDTPPPLPGLHALLGLGARGIVWAPLAAELLAAGLEGEPLPLEQALVDAVDPARFERRRRRRGASRAARGGL